MVNEPDQQTVTWATGTGDDVSARLSALDGSSASLEVRPPTRAGTGLVSLWYLWGALRRTAKYWGALALAGLIIGVGYIVAVPPPYHATVSVLLVGDPSQTPANEVQTDLTLAESLPVATAVVQQLGLPQTPSEFAGSYSVTPTTDNILTINVKATSSDEAVRIASAVATQFLDYRASYEQTQQTQTNDGLNQEVAQAQQQLDSLTAELSQVSAQPSSPAQQAKLASLKKQRTAAASNLQSVQGYASQAQVTSASLTQKMVHGSQVLNQAMPVKRSMPKNVLLYGIGGLLAGLVLGWVIVIIGAVTTDRLRRRDDIAYTFSAPVRLSVGRLRASPLLPALPRQAAARRRGLTLVVDYLRNVIPGSSQGPASLAVVAVDDAPTVAKAVVELATAKAKEGSRVVLADLTSDGDAARLLDVHGAGIGKVTPDGTRFVLVVPDSLLAPVGPLESHASPDGYAEPDKELVSAAAEADLVIALVTLDPALGAEHLATWAADAVAVVTAGRTTAVRMQAVGEMIRLAGTRLGSVVVIGADKHDETLGVTRLV